MSNPFTYTSKDGVRMGLPPDARRHTFSREVAGRVLACEEIDIPAGAVERPTRRVVAWCLFPFEAAAVEGRPNLLVHSDYDETDDLHENILALVATRTRIQATFDALHGGAKADRRDPLVDPFPLMKAVAAAARIPDGLARRMVLVLDVEHEPRLYVDGFLDAGRVDPVIDALAQAGLINVKPGPNEPVNTTTVHNERFTTMRPRKNFEGMHGKVQKMVMTDRETIGADGLPRPVYETVEVDYTKRHAWRTTSAGGHEGWYCDRCHCATINDPAKVPPTFPCTNAPEVMLEKAKIRAARVEVVADDGKPGPVTTRSVRCSRIFRAFAAFIDSPGVQGSFREEDLEDASHAVDTLVRIAHRYAPGIALHDFVNIWAPEEAKSCASVKTGETSPTTTSTTPTSG